MQFLRPTGHISLPVMCRLEITPAFDIKGEGSDSVPVNKESTDNSRLLLKKKRWYTGSQWIAHFWMVYLPVFCYDTKNT